MTPFDYAVEKVRQNMLRQPTIEEARKALKDCGILDEDGNVVEAYRDIVVPMVRETGHE